MDPILGTNIQASAISTASILVDHPRCKYQFKILILGDAATGKYCFVQQYLHQLFTKNRRLTNDCDVSTTTVSYDDTTVVRLEIYNVASSVGSKMKLYYREAVGCFIMFDVSQPETFDAIAKWKKDLDNTVKLIDGTPLPCILLANKCDLAKDKNVALKMAKLDNYCRTLGFTRWFETSGKANVNIEISVLALISDIIDRIDPTPVIVSPIPAAVVPMDLKREYTFKIVVIGELCTGKSAIIKRYVENVFTDNYKTTVGTDFALKTIKYDDETSVKLHFWDIAGDERFGNTTHVYYRNAVGCLIVCDIARPSTIEVGAVKWKVDLDNKVELPDGSQVPCLLLNNKCDLVKEGIATSRMLMDEFCRKNNIVRWFETSAKENINIVTAIRSLVDEIMKRQNKLKRHKRLSSRESDSSSIQLDSQLPRNIRSTHCCFSSS